MGLVDLIFRVTIIRGSDQGHKLGVKGPCKLHFHCNCHYWAHARSEGPLQYNSDHDFQSNKYGIFIEMKATLERISGIYDKEIIVSLPLIGTLQK